MAALAITIDKCVLIDVFRQEFAPALVDDLVCTARWESHYNTSAIGTLNWDGSKDLGLFQVSEKWWCEWGSKGKGCRMDCNGRVYLLCRYNLLNTVLNLGKHLQTCISRCVFDIQCSIRVVRVRLSILGGWRYTRKPSSRNPNLVLTVQ